ncbi:uncharacterized protein LOC107762765 [Nicotiana tabacum]|uniref:Uncharacterized protein LOC107762765 n=2 Tax=Nicotiana TaxID=4085 RepID=A0A1S3X9Z7_TOBAC|nr:PREDICTED: uncharacterized protein LOC104214514 [Nicotiana sylvestris]XP_016436634.1 PREDICTED: uncharacterized protein LOC107762765 [Nicotiana tabacum]
MDLSITSKNPSFCTNNVQQQQQKAVGMNKLREAILKLSNSEPNGPLSPTQNSILQQRLSHFLSSLHTTPDHPPYSWMIQRALQELDEAEGSTEDSISKFIKKEYDDLPVAHMFLLKHHLQKLSENGEILMIDGGGRFLLAGGGDNSLNPETKTKRKYKKRKGRWGWEIKPKKRRRKEKKEKKHDDVQVVKEERKLDEQQNVVNHGQQNGIHRELNGHHNEPNTDKEEGQLSARQNGVTGNKVLPKGGLKIRLHKQKGMQQFEGPPQSFVSSESDVGSKAGSEHLDDLKLQQQKLSLSGVEETADICSLYPLETEQPEDNLPQILSPQAPPGFEFTVVEDATANNSASVALDSAKEDYVKPRIDDLSDASKQSKESLKQQREYQYSNDGSMSSATVLSLNQNQQTERLEDELVAEDLLKTKNQQKQHDALQQLKNTNEAQRKGTVTQNAPLVLTLQCEQREQHISDRGTRQVQLTPSEPKQQLSVPRRLTRSQLKEGSRTQLFASKQLEQERSSSEPKQLTIQRKRTRTQLKAIITQPASSTDLFALKHLEQENSPELKQQIDKPYDLSKKTGALLNEMIIPDTHGSLDKREAQQLIELSKMEESHEIVLATVEPSSEKKQQLEEGTSTLEKLNEDDDSTGFEAVSIEISSQTDREQRQLKRWSRDRSEPKSVSTSEVEPLPFCASADKHLVQFEEPLALATSEEALNLTDPQHEVSLEQPKRQLRRRPPEYKEDEAKLGTSTVSVLATNEEALPDKRTNEEVLCLNDSQHEVHFKQQIQKRRGRIPKGNDDGAKPDTTILKKLGVSKKSKKKQNGRGLGRPRKTQ